MAQKLSSNLVAIKLEEFQVLVNKLIDLSKICVYDFHCNFMRKQLGNDCKILYTDTDSLISGIKNQNLCALIRSNIHASDTSEYPTENQFDMPLKNKNVVGLMKDECNGKIITEFVGLRSKMYSVRVKGKYRIKKAKGVKMSVVQ